MGAMEISLIIAGVIIIAVSFMITDKKNRNEENGKTGEDVKNITQNMIKEEIQNQLAMLSDDVLENAEAKLDQLANQKIMAVGNYSEDVLKNIEDNHNEVMFLYNMLNDKETTLKNTVRDIEAVKVSVKKLSDTVNKKENNSQSAPKDKGEKKQENGAVGEPMQMNEMGKTSAPVPDMLNQNSRNGEEADNAGNKERILRLYRKGKTNVEIAQELNLGVGEVNLVLGLFK